MSKRLKPIYRPALLLALILQIFNNSSAQTAQIKIKISDSNAFVEGSFIDANQAKGVTNFSFPKSYAGIENLGARIGDVNLFDKNGQKINYKKLADGEFLAESGFQKWNYSANLTPKSVAAMAHVSGISGEQGILMLGDLLPELAEEYSAKIAFELPKDWRVSSVEIFTSAKIIVKENLRRVRQS
jgi:hypothetical protein